MMKLKKQIICKMKAKNTGKRPKRRRRPVKRLVETSEDVYKLKLQLDYNLDILFESILMHLIIYGSLELQRKKEDQKHFHFSTRVSDILS